MVIKFGLLVLVFSDVVFELFIVEFVVNYIIEGNGIIEELKGSNLGVLDYYGGSDK